MTSNGQPTPSARSSRNLYIVAERDRENTLPDERAHAMFDETRRPPVPKAAGKPVDEPDGAIGRSQKQAARVRGHRAAIEIGRYAPPLDRPKQIEIRATLRPHREPLLLRASRSSKTTFSDSEPRCTYFGEISGLVKLDSFDGTAVAEANPLYVAGSARRPYASKQNQAK